MPREHQLAVRGNSLTVVQHHTRDPLQWSLVGVRARCRYQSYEEARRSVDKRGVLDRVIVERLGHIDALYVFEVIEHVAPAPRTVPRRRRQRRFHRGMSGIVRRR